MTIDKALLTAEDLYTLPEPPNGGHYELLDGELVEMAAAGWEHGRVMGTVSFLLMTYVIPRGLGAVASGDVGVILRRDPDRVRAPDVCFIAKERLPVGPARRRFLRIVPDLVVEIVSPDDTRREVDEKAREWASAGVRLTLVLDPDKRTVTAYRGEADVRVYAATDLLDAAPVLPDFTVPVAELFA